MTGEIAVGVPMFSRERALEQFLESVPSYVSTAYVADNGRPETRPLYDGSDRFAFDVEVLQLDYDAGIGACRQAIERAVTEPYLWLGDNDMAFTRRTDLRVLREILDSDPMLGGVAGWLLEDARVRSGARDIEVVGSTLVKQARDPEIDAEPYPHARFDYIPQAALFRSDVFETYRHDDALREREHADFFLTHRERGSWEFASTPTVTVVHDTEIDAEYRRDDRGRHLDEADKVIADKWGIENISYGPTHDWAHYNDRSIPEAMFDVFRRAAPASVWLPVRRALSTVVGGRNS